MAGLMNSGMITIGMTIPRPRNGRTIATASSSPSTSSSATTADESTIVLISAVAATGSTTTSLKFCHPTKSWPGIWKS